MNKIQEIIYNVINYGEINKNNLINILDNLTNVERDIIFNKIYYINNYNNTDNILIYDYTFLQIIYISYHNENNILIDLLKKYKNNININTKNLQGKTLLYYIIIHNENIEILEYICELYKDVNINILDNNCENMLSTIIIKYIYYNEKIVKLLLEKDAKIQYKLLKHLIDLCDYLNMNILLDYLHKNNDYDYVLEELHNYVIENYKINENNKELYDKIFTIKSNTKSAAKILAPGLSLNMD